MLHLIRIVALIPLLLASLLAQGHGSASHGGGGSAQRSTMQMDESEFFIQQYTHLEPHAVWTPGVPRDPDSPDPARTTLLTFYNVNLFQLGVVAFIAVLFLGVRFSFGGARTPWLLRLFRGWCLWIRDEMVYPVVGPEHGTRLAPYFIFLFFFIALLNLVSLVPGSVTAMATIWVTGALALQSLVMIVWFGVRTQGVGGFLGHLVAPPGVPAFVLPIMAPVEILSLFVKPLALMIRLFANLLAGHMVLYSFIGIIFVFAKMMDMGPLGYLTAALGVGLAVFVTILEGFIVLLQAYIFTYLSLIFVGQMVQQHHEAH